MLTILLADRYYVRQKMKLFAPNHQILVKVILVFLLFKSGVKMGALKSLHFSFRVAIILNDYISGFHQLIP